MPTNIQLAQKIQARAEERQEAALAHARIVVDKLCNGTYVLEDKPCFCGSTQETELVDADRYGLPHRMVVCEECALIRANPRLTAESYANFYNDHYRFINYLTIGDEQIAEYSDQEIWENIQAQKVPAIKEVLENFQVAQKPKVVVDYGCHLGGIVAGWSDVAEELWGIEIDEKSAAVARGKGIKVVSSIEELIAKGVKADLVIMQDIIEHLLDLRTEMKKVGSIMKPDGILYVWTPGLFKRAVDGLWQLPHTYQFCCQTLEYVMTNCGFVPEYCDEEVTSMWRYVGDSVKGFEKPVEWVQFEKDSAFHVDVRKLPPFRGFCKFSRKELYEHVAKNLAHKCPDLSEITKTYSGPVMILAGGPSVDGQVDEIIKLHREMPLICIAKMYPWCIKHKIMPDFVVTLDSMPDQVECFDTLLPGVIYLCATVSHEEIFNQLHNEEVYIWDSRDDLRMTQMRLDAGYRRCTVINTGSSVAIAAMSLSFNLGFDHPHVFGFDCMVKEREMTHSKDIGGTNVVPTIFEVSIDGEMILTSASWLEFARQALNLAQAAKDEGVLKDLTFHGETLCMKLWDGVWQSE